MIYDLKFKIWATGDAASLALCLALDLTPGRQVERLEASHA